MNRRAVVAILGALGVACSSGEGAATTEDFHAVASVTECAGCHPSHVEEWKSSPHAYAMLDPVFQAMVGVGQTETKGELGDFCVKCHSPLGNLLGQTKVTHDAATGAYVQPTRGLSEEAMDGVSCLTCHSITKLKGPANADFDLSLDGIRRGPIHDPDPSPVHGSEYSSNHTNSLFCGTCHVVVNQKNVPLEQTYSEWVASIFNGAQSCQDCHMEEYQGPAAVGHRTRTVHRHSFVGADVSLLEPDVFPGYDDVRAKAASLLQRSVHFEASPDAAKRRIDVTIQNLAGHALPSGATADREMWIELIVRDDQGSVALESGTLDERGDLRVANADRTTRPGTDPQLVLYTQDMEFDPKLDDPASQEAPNPVDFLWEPNQATNRLVPVGVTDIRSFDLSSLASGHYTAALRLLFRSFPPHLLRKLEGAGGLDPTVKDRVPTVEMATSAVDFTL